MATQVGIGAQGAQSTEYAAQYNEFVNLMDNKDKTACDKLDALRSMVVALRQIRETYIPRPCFRSLPYFCPFTQHRSEIDKLIERLEPMEAGLRRSCAQQQNDARIAKVAAEVGKQHTEVDVKQAASAKANPMVAQGNISVSKDTHITIPELVKPNEV